MTSTVTGRDPHGYFALVRATVVAFALVVAFWVGYVIGLFL
jgi:hypothetical protein